MGKSFNDVLTGGYQMPEIRSPVEVLDELAESMYQKVGRKFVFEVMTTSVADGLSHSLRIVVPQLDNYILEVLRVSHSVLKLYPAQINGLFAPQGAQAKDEDELFDQLAGIFNSKEARTIIETLLAQVKTRAAS